MPFSIDFLYDGRLLEWEATADGAVATERDDYTPRFYVAPRDPETDLDLTTFQSVYDPHSDVVATEMVWRGPGFLGGEEAVLAVDVARIDRVTALARQAPQPSDYPVGDLACFNIDFSGEFRYYLETGVDPMTASELSTHTFSRYHGLDLTNSLPSKDLVRSDSIIDEDVSSVATTSWAVSSTI
jgi:DNA polymerase I